METEANLSPLFREQARLEQPKWVTQLNRLSTATRVLRHSGSVSSIVGFYGGLFAISINNPDLLTANGVLFLSGIGLGMTGEFTKLFAKSSARRHGFDNFEPGRTKISLDRLALLQERSLRQD